MNVIKNSSLLAKFFNAEKLMFTANPLNSLHSDTARFAWFTSFNFHLKFRM